MKETRPRRVPTLRLPLLKALKLEKRIFADTKDYWLYLGVWGGVNDKNFCEAGSTNYMNMCTLYILIALYSTLL